MTPIKTLPELYNANKLYEEYKKINIAKSQIYLSSHDGKTYEFSNGTIYEYDNTDQNDYTKINEIFKGTYFEEVYNDVDQKYKVCRARIMTMKPPENRAYSYHYDQSPRLHIPIKTNRDSMFLINDTVYRMPEEGRLYFMDTIQLHSALNLSRGETRIHLVFCVRNNEVL